MPTAEECYEFALNSLKIGDRNTAKLHLERACLLDPGHSRAFAVRGSLLYDSGQFFDAILNYDRAIANDPDAQYLTNKSSALAELDQWDQAEEALQQAVKRNPKLVQAWSNLGYLLLVRGKLNVAETAFRVALGVDRSCHEAHMGLAFLELQQGRFEEGWQRYEWRKLKLPHRYIAPEWLGGKLADDEAILLRSEQGLGDVIQFCRYAPLLKRQFGGKVYLETRAPLLRLLNTLEGIDGVVGYGDPIPSDVKYTQMLLSCPWIFKHFSEDEFPGQESYLKAPQARVDDFALHTSILRDDVLKVGFCWAGNTGMAANRRRSTNLSMWAPLAEVPGIGWISLQHGPPAVQLRQNQVNMTVLDLVGDCDDMADTAALVMNCDLVITIDTSIAHLAAALGKPTWVLSRRDACWRWMGDRKDSPWYPTVRHYRQHVFNDWSGLMKTVANDLVKFQTDFSSRKEFLK